MRKTGHGIGVLLADVGRTLRAGNRKFAMCVLVLLCGDICTAQAVFSTDREFGPVRLSREQLVEMVVRLQAFAGGQDSAPSGSGDASHMLSMSDGRRTVVISEEISMEALDSAPDDVTAVRYTGRYRTGVISATSFRFSDRARTLAARG